MLIAGTHPPPAVHARACTLHRHAPSRPGSPSATPRRRPASSSCRKRWAAAWRSSTPTAMAGSMCSSPTARRSASTRRRRGRRTSASPRFWNRLYRNLGGWKFEDVTERSGLAGTRYDFGAAAADYDNDGDVDLHVTGLRRQHPLPQRRERHVHRCHGVSRSRGIRDGRRAPRSWTTTTMAASICTSAGISPGRGTSNPVCPSADGTDARLLPSAAVRAAFPPCSCATTATAPSAIRRPRAASPLIRERRSASPFTITTAMAASTSSWPTTRCSSSCSGTRTARTFAGVALAGRRRLRRRRAELCRDGHRRRGLRQRRLAGRDRDHAQPGALRPVPRDRTRRFRVRLACERDRPRHAPGLGMGDEVRGLRQRRTARSVRGAGPRPRYGHTRAPGLRLSPAAAHAAQRRAPRLRSGQALRSPMSPRRSGRHSPARPPAAAPPSPISTTTATSTSSSPTSTPSR